MSYKTTQGLEVWEIVDQTHIFFGSNYLEKASNRISITENPSNDIKETPNAD